MTQKNEAKQEKKKSILARLMESIDKKMEEKAQKAPCCGSSNKKGSSCC